MDVVKRLFNNFLPLLILRGFEYILPLMTVPYLVRILGKSGYGSMALSMSLATFFTVFTNYGFEFTATRKISINKNSVNTVSRYYSVVLTARLMLLFVSFILMNILVFSLKSFSVEWELYYIAFIYVIGYALFPVWFFQGMERTKYISIVTIVPRAIFAGLIFVCIKGVDDLFLSVLLQSAPLLLSGIMSVYIVRTKFHIKYQIPTLNEIKECLKDGFGIFLSSFMTYVLASSGTLVLGMFANRGIVGVYSAIEKITKAIIGMFSPFFQAIFPYISEKFNENYQAGIKFLKKTSKYVIVFSIIVMFIMIGLSSKILVLLYGKSYDQYSLCLQLFSIWVLFSIVNNFIGIQYLIASGKQSLYSKSFTISSLMTLVLFFTLIPFFTLYGTIIGVVSGEIVLTCVMIIFIKRASKTSKLTVERK
ncbi:flippase [Sporolactobacillus terrae]|uniref:flippase n=1 Tax=Sporolactobacillus terrae TaxID=269673 RepID=UPI001CBD9F3D|nr:flippase [Sporolactobacillus terrae]UAK16363.1 flippase [Sporolactobacillus terrae]